MNGVEALTTVLRAYASDLARFIEADEVLGNYGGLTVIVEDRADVETQVNTAITKATGGVAVLVAVTGFRRRPNSGELLTGTIDFQVSVHENPLFNRKGQFVLTAQCVAERLAALLHWARVPGYDNRLLFEDLVRADDNAANVVVVRLHAEQTLRGVIE